MGFIAAELRGYPFFDRKEVGTSPSEIQENWGHRTARLAGLIDFLDADGLTFPQELVSPYIEGEIGALTILEAVRPLDPESIQGDQQ